MPDHVRAKRRWVYIGIKFSLTFLLGFCTAVAVASLNFQTIFGSFAGLGKRSVRTSTCREFLAGGHLEGSDWQPDGCRMLHYSDRSISECLNRTQFSAKRRNFFLFLGDSRVRELYHVFVKSVVGKRYTILPDKLSVRYVDTRFEAEFHFISKMQYVPGLPDILTRRRIPTFIVIYFGTWFMIDCGGDFQLGYSRLLERLNVLSGVLRELSNVTKVLFLVNAPTIRYTEHRDDACRGVFFKGRMQRVSINRNKSVCAHQWLINDWIRQYNKAMVEMMTNGSSCGSSYLWTSAKHIAQHFAFDTLDGLHLLPVSFVAPPSKALFTQAQVLLNFHCNQFREVLDMEQHDDELCCRNNDH